MQRKATEAHLKASSQNGHWIHQQATAARAGMIGISGHTPAKA